jgi:hypothetical protein
MTGDIERNTSLAVHAYRSNAYRSNATETRDSEAAAEARESAAVVLDARARRRRAALVVANRPELPPESHPQCDWR